MDEESQKNKTKNVPYTTIVNFENSLRQKMDGWRFRVITNVLRQSPSQIIRFTDRYKDPLN